MLHVTLLALLQIPDPVVDLTAFVKFALDALMSGKFPLLAAIVVGPALILLDKVLSPKFPILANHWVQLAIATIGSTAGAVASALYTGAAFSWVLVAQTLAVTIGSMYLANVKMLAAAKGVDAAAKVDTLAAADAVLKKEG